MEQFEAIRRAHREEELSVRTLARRFRVHRRVVRQALSSPVPPPRKVPERESPALGPYRAVIREWLTEDLSAPRKQRHTARRVWQRLRDEHGAQLAESTVRRHVAEIKAELGAAGLVTVPQTHGPGEEGEADFGKFSVWLGGALVELWMFCLRLSCSGRGFHVAYASQAQECFFDGHVLAFEHFGGVPGRIRYDNLKPAVARVLFGRNRVENERFIVLRSHYGFDSFYCLPGKDGAHEKGGVEGEVGRFRRNKLVPVPRVGSLAELNELMLAADLADDARRIGARPATVGESFAAEVPFLRPLPAEPFDVASELDCRVDGKSRVAVRQSFYSVPARLARRQVRVRLGARSLEVVADGKVVARHERSLHKGTEDLVLDHYLEILLRKPGALPGATALAQARRSGAFTKTHDRFWDEARRRLGDAAGTRALIAVLLLHRTLDGARVTAGMDAALAAGTVDPDVVTIEARRHDQRIAPVIPIGAAHQERPAPTLDSYDQLLEGNA